MTHLDVCVLQLQVGRTANPLLLLVLRLVLLCLQVTSSAKKKRSPDSTRIHQTPEGAFYDLQRNAWQVSLRLDCCVSVGGKGGAEGHCNSQCEHNLSTRPPSGYYA
jgi:hypothetical protein